MIACRGWVGDLFFVADRMWGNTTGGVPVRTGREPELLTTDPALSAETIAEQDARARAAIEAAADAEIDVLLAARGWRYEVCGTCHGRGVVHAVHATPDRAGWCTECAAEATRCPDCARGVRRVREKLEAAMVAAQEEP